MPRARIGRTFTFEASHHLPWHTGECRFVHGHSYRLLVEVSGALNKNGVVWDFREMKEFVQEHVLATLDHSSLNTSFVNPTAEIIAQVIWTRLSSKLPSGIALETVRLYEGGDGYAETRRTPTGS